MKLSEMVGERTVKQAFSRNSDAGISENIGWISGKHAYNRATFGE
jgi:hypothetical protein